MRNFGRGTLEFFREHGYQLLFLLLLISINIMCIFLPIFSVVAVFFIAPVTAYFMRRYVPFVPLIIYPIFAVISHFTTGNNVYLYFPPIFILSSLGLYYALRMRVFWRGVILSVSCVFVATLFATGMCMIFAGKTNFISAVSHEILTSKSSFVRSNAESYFNSAFKDEADRETFRILEDVEMIDGMSEEEFAMMYVYSKAVEQDLSTNLLMYMVKLSVLLGFGGYLIAGLICQHLKCEVNVPINITEVRLPKGFGIYSVLSVAVGYLLYIIWDFFLPAHLAIYHGAMLAPFAVYGLCFAVYVAKLIPYKPLQAVLICVIILMAAASFFTDFMIIIFAIMGVADYVVNFRHLIKMLQE